MKYERGLYHYKGFIGLTVASVMYSYEAWKGAQRFHGVRAKKITS